jgi:hypothetical protein
MLICLKNKAMLEVISTGQASPSSLIVRLTDIVSRTLSESTPEKQEQLGPDELDDLAA